MVLILHRIILIVIDNVVNPDLQEGRTNTEVKFLIF